MSETTPAPTSAAPGLLPCPFCGGGEIVVEMNDSGNHWDVRCDICCANTFGSPVEDVIAAWNTRAALAEQQAAARPAPWVDVERLRALVAKWRDDAKNMRASGRTSRNSGYQHACETHAALLDGCATELEAALAPADGAVTQGRDGRQSQVAAWCAAAFGQAQASALTQRGVRMLEEAIEAYQAVSGDPAMAHKLVDFVFARPVGEIAKEIGALGLTTLALAEAAGVSADAEEAREVARVLAKPIEHWSARNRAKNAAGFLTIPAPPAALPAALPADEGERT